LKKDYCSRFIFVLKSNIKSNKYVLLFDR